MKAGKVGALLMYETNPVYTLSNGAEFAESLKKVKLSVAFSMTEDETASKSQYIAAIPHYLESWGDVNIKKGEFGLMQPTINPLFETRQFQDTLLKWMESSQAYYDYLKEYWDSNILNGTSWNQALHDGMAFNDAASTELTANEIDLSESLLALSSVKESDLELSLYTKVGLGNGQMANNPWLQEFPDPITRVSWDNYVTVSKSDAKSLGLKNINETWTEASIVSTTPTITVGNSYSVPDHLEIFENLPNF